jgi:putative toxin-antitoxin system antitoxin component (TIGR02293 family)
MFANHGGLSNRSWVELNCGAGDFAMPAFAVLGYDYRKESSRVLLATDAAVDSSQEQRLKLMAARKVRHNIRVARVTTRAQQIFAGQPAYAAVWLREPKSSLGDLTPLQLLATESGALVVEEQLAGIEHGMFG